MYDAATNATVNATAKGIQQLCSENPQACIGISAGSGAAAMLLLIGLALLAKCLLCRHKSGMWGRSGAGSKTGYRSIPEQALDTGVAPPTATNAM